MRGGVYMPDVSMEYTISRCLQDNILTSPSDLKKKIRLCSNNHWQCRTTSVPQYKTLKSAYRRLIFRCSVNEVTRLIEITFTRLLYIIKCDLFVLLMLYDFVIDRNCLYSENIWGGGGHGHHGLAFDFQLLHYLSVIL